jgi:XrtJ-associated TM-motif-TM protein
MKLARLLAILALPPALAHAQGGCVNSPENPTVVLALIGMAGASLLALRNRKNR